MFEPGLDVEGNGPISTIRVRDCSGSPQFSFFAERGLQTKSPVPGHAPIYMRSITVNRLKRLSDL
jgi:hypothetical protein